MQQKVFLFFIVWRLTFFCWGVALAARDLLMAAWATAAAAFVESAEKYEHNLSLLSSL